MLKFIRVRFILLAFLLGITPLVSSAQVTITIAPPPLPVYDQPFCPGDGNIWVPGYWAYGADDSYGVPASWALAPQPAFLCPPPPSLFASRNHAAHPRTCS